MYIKYLELLVTPKFYFKAFNHALSPFLCSVSTVRATECAYEFNDDGLNSDILGVKRNEMEGTVLPGNKSVECPNEYFKCFAMWIQNMHQHVLLQGTVCYYLNFKKNKK